MIREGDKPLFDDRCVLAHCAKPRAYRVWNRSRRQADWEEHRVACHYANLVYVDVERAFTERSKSLLNAPSPRKWWSTVNTAVFWCEREL